MVVVSLDCKDDGYIIYDYRHEIVNLRKPFQPDLVDERIQKRGNVDSTISPSQTFTRSQRPRAYRLKFKHETAKMFVSGSCRLQCQLIYDTNRSLSELFRDKLIHHILANLHTDSNPYTNIRHFLSRIINRIGQSYPFDCILTDIPALSVLDIDIPIVQRGWSLVRLPDNLTWFPSHARLVKLILREHNQVPLHCLDGKMLKMLRWEYTDFQEEDLYGHKNILLITGTNKYYAGFVGRELRRMDYQEVLPVVLFGINRYK